jgi:peptidoglycan/xylan/chitin deacetylase (PgdA/CDA1 family)
MPINITHRLISLISGPRLSIFIFHRVLPKHDPLIPGEPSIEQFDAIVRWIKKDFNVYALGEALERFKRNQNGKPIAAITFDDGYADNYHHAMPILKKHGLAATFFIATGYLDGGRMWNDSIIETVRCINGSLDLHKFGIGKFELNEDADRLNCIEQLIKSTKYLNFENRLERVHQICSLINNDLPTGLMMSSAELSLLAESGMEIGAHTHSHPILSKLNSKNSIQEIVGGKEFLESLLKTRIDLFAYPNGKPGQDYFEEHVMAVKKAGFKAAVSTHNGVTKLSDNYFELPRFTPWQRDQLHFRISSIRNSL